MTISLTECIGENGRYLLQDLATYTSVDKLVAAILNKETMYHPLDFSVKWRGRWHPFIVGGCVTDEAEKSLKALKRLPANGRQIPNDTVIVNADIFEKELFIDMYGA